MELGATKTSWKLPSQPKLPGSLPPMRVAAMLWDVGRGKVTLPAAGFLTGTALACSQLRLLGRRSTARACRCKAIQRSKRVQMTRPALRASSLAEMATEERWRVRFEEYAEGIAGHRWISREGLRSCLQCTESFCLSENWLPHKFVDEIICRYASGDGESRSGSRCLAYEDFIRLASDGMLLEGKIHEYEQAFNGIDKAGKGWISTEEIEALFKGLHRPISGSTLASLLVESGSQDGRVGLGQFLHIARKQLDLGEVLDYLALREEPCGQSPQPRLLHHAVHAPYGQVTRIRSGEDLEQLIASGDKVLVQLAFTWCKPCKKFAPTYERFAATTDSVRFVKMYGNDNESTKHYGKTVIKAKASPLFIAYRNGQLAGTWPGVNEERFRQNLEDLLIQAD
eukprot:TRINITY_DN84186_c0_g1_i1.p1 TRINITY_DN84186_c0_g1~~TRINITY_DN84186_c0_g1_i1.p1  ORF type:complete len:397 (+),score=78.79 TRINITY_DN84186_c0_g1_i1:38-1228(+)